MLLTKDQLIIASIGIISLILFSFIIGDVLGIVCLFSNPTLTKTLFGVFLFFPATFILFLSLLYMVSGGWNMCSDNGDGTKFKRGLIMLKQAMIASLLFGTFILVTNVIFLKVPFGIHLLFSYSFLLLTPFGLKVFERGWLAIPEKDRNALFIAWFIPLLEQIIPKQDHEEWMGLLKIGHDKSIKEGKHLIFVNLETLKNGLCLIGGSLWLKADKFVSGWMTRAK
ncbi:MAG: hypothetical protein EAZ60_06770 [Oscillatoriales cyanobacterium]|nr:MAG: hypothetical protein EAZ83_27970 [Oscillatoriales cyanobacterium]TAF31209.1 MAG: hypothetical protein EAZ69_19960 [Oscillatoriales cyanobacterium]TAF57493.1 MAG: hypothetical protein EAZ60_06770 [Oscillatoriales cyanobacterium]